MLLFIKNIAILPLIDHKRTVPLNVQNKVPNPAYALKNVLCNFK
jgi:hypothetical protein